jgi:hypothetical protein
MATDQSTGAQQPAARGDSAAREATHRAEESGELVAMSFPGARPVAGWLFWVVFPLLCLATASFAAASIAVHVGSKPIGISGTYLADRTCSRGICLVSGTFVSDDGRVRVESLLGDPRWKPGQLHHVRYDSKDVEVVAQPGHFDPTPYVLAGVGALTYLAVVGRLAATTRRSRRTGAATAGAVPAG